MSSSRRAEMRRYEPRDRDAVRNLCCDTGFLGQPVDPVFEDRDLFADYLTRYYTDIEPESAFVVLVHGEVKGYLLGSRRPWRQQWFNIWSNLRLLARGVFRYRRYNEATDQWVDYLGGGGPDSLVYPMALDDLP